MTTGSLLSLRESSQQLRGRLRKNTVHIPLVCLSQSVNEEVLQYKSHITVTSISSILTSWNLVWRHTEDLLMPAVGLLKLRDRLIRRPPPPSPFRAEVEEVEDEATPLPWNRAAIQDLCG